MPGADGWQLSNVNVLASAAHLASLEIFEAAGMEALRDKSVRLTGYLQYLLDSLPVGSVEIITPSSANDRGCQLSLVIHQNGSEVFKSLSEQGVMADWREPHIPGKAGIIRVAPVPLYNTFTDVYQFYEMLKAGLNE